jgi:hypothetical protein
MNTQVAGYIERLTLGETAKRLQRSDRSVRRYVHEGRLEYERIDMPAGGWQYLISAASVERLRRELQGVQTTDHANEHIALLEDLKALKAEVALLRHDVDQLGSLVGQLMPTPPPGQKVRDARRKYGRIAGVAQLKPDA